MHAFFMTRGIKQDVDLVVKFLETRTFLLPFTDMKTGLEKFQPIQGNLQPIQLWSYVFPEYERDKVLTSLKFDEENRKRWTSDLKMKAAVEGLRLMLGAKKIPSFSKEQRMLMPLAALNNVSIIPIGIKEDGVMPDSHDDTVHESL